MMLRAPAVAALLLLLALTLLVPSVAGASVNNNGTGTDPDQLWLCTPEFCARGSCVPASQCRGAGKAPVWPSELVHGTAAPASTGGNASAPVCCVELPLTPNAAASPNNATCAGQDKCARLHSGSCMLASQCPFALVPGEGLCQGANATMGIGCCPSAGSTNDVLTGSEALGYLRATTAGAVLQSSFACEQRAPGCTTLDGVRDHVVLRLAALFPASSGCSLTILAGTEFGHDDHGIETHQAGYRVTLLATPCVDTVATAGNRSTQLAEPDRCSEEFVRATSRWCRLNATRNWDVVFRAPRASPVDSTREANVRDEKMIESCIARVNSIKNVTGQNLFSFDYGYLARHARSCSDTCNTSAPLPPTTGGVFAVSREIFAAAQKFACGCGNEYLPPLLRAVLNEDFCAMSYRAADACVVSGIVVRLYYMSRGFVIAQTPSAQVTMFASNYSVANVTLAPGDATRCTTRYFNTAKPCETARPTALCRLVLGIVLDESGSIGQADFNTAVAALRSFVGSSTLALNSRIAMVQFSTYPRVAFNFTTPANAYSLLASRPYAAGGTYTDEGMQLMLDMFPSKDAAVPGELYVMLVATDGQSSNSWGLERLTDSYMEKYSHIIPFAVGIGGYTYQELLQIAQYNENNVLTLRDFTAFSANMMVMMTELCRNSATVANNRTTETVNVSVTNMQPFERRYVNINISSTDAIDIRLLSDAGCVEAYVSTRIRTPSEALHDLHIKCNESGPVTFRVGASSGGTSPKNWAQYSARRGMKALSVDEDVVTLYFAFVATQNGTENNATLRINQPLAMSPPTPTTASSSPPTTPSPQPTTSAPPTTTAPAGTGNTTNATVVTTTTAFPTSQPATTATMSPRPSTVAPTDAPVGGPNNQVGSPDSSALSDGAVLGIVVGLVAAVFAFMTALGVVLFLYCRRISNAQKQLDVNPITIAVEPQHPPPNDPHSVPAAEPQHDATHPAWSPETHNNGYSGFPE